MERVFSAVFNRDDPGVAPTGSLAPFKTRDEAVAWLKERRWPRSRDVKRLFRHVRRRRQAAAKARARPPAFPSSPLQGLVATTSGSGAHVPSMSPPLGPAALGGASGAPIAAVVSARRARAPSDGTEGTDGTDASAESAGSDGSEEDFRSVPSDQVVMAALRPFTSPGDAVKWLNKHREEMVANAARRTSWVRGGSKRGRSRRGASGASSDTSSGSASDSGRDTLRGAITIPELVLPKSILRTGHLPLTPSKRGRGSSDPLEDMDYCPSHALDKGLRGFVYAYGFKALMALLVGMLPGRKNRLKTALAAVTSKRAIRFGLFWGALMGSHSFLRWALAVLRGKDGRLNALVAGGIAGISILLDDPASASSIALYALVRSLFVVSHTLMRHKVIPRTENASYALFALANAPIMYAAMLEPDLLARGYYKWMLNIANMSHEGIGVMREPYENPELPFRQCGAPWHEGRCFTAHTSQIPTFLALCAKLYTPVHALPVVVFRGKNLLKDPVGNLTHVASGIAKSSGFLTGYIWLLKTTVCFLRNARGQDSWWHAPVGGLLTFLPLQLEHPKRVSELMLYCAPHAIRVVWGKLRAQGHVKDWRHANLAMFMTAAALCLSAERCDYKPTYAAALSFLFGREEPGVLDKW